MKLSLKKELKYQSIAKALKANLKKRKLFRNKNNKEKEEKKNERFT